MITIFRRLTDESGVILVASTMGIFIVLSIFAFYLARFSILETRSGAYHIQDIKVRNLAMTGLEHGLQNYKLSRNISNLSGNFNNGSYTVTFDSNSDESGSLLPFSHYVTLKSSASIDDVKRNIRLIISALPEAFCFSLYANNTQSQSFSTTNGTIVGDMFFKGDIIANNGFINGIAYSSTGNGGTLIENYPSFPQIDITIYESLITEASAAAAEYTNYALNFDGSNDYVQISNSSDINTGTYTQKTIEAWFIVNNKDQTSYKQTIYEQGGTVRGLNIYIYGGSLYVGGWNEPSSESNWNPGTWLSTSTVQNNTWHHVAMTLNGGGTVTNNAIKGYLDGVEFGSGDGSKLWNHPGDVSIARHKDTKFHSGDYNSAQYFLGAIDELRLWNTTRTASQIAAKKDTVLDGDEIGLTAYYNFQENSGAVANDSENQSNNDGSIKNGASWISGPELSKMSSNNFTNITIDLNNYQNNKLLINGNLTFSNVTIVGPGYIVADGTISISSNTSVYGNIFIVCGSDLTVNESSLGSSMDAAVISYSEGNTSFNNSTIYGLIISAGVNSNLEFVSTKVYGAILNYSSNFTISSDSDIIGSVVSNYSVEILDQYSSITRGNIPEFSGKDLGLQPFVVPGSYLEF